MMRAKSRRRLAWLAAGLLAAWCSSAKGAEPVVFDCSAGHQYDGFGVNLFPLGGREAALVEVLQELKVNYVRWGALLDLNNADVPEGLTFEAMVDWLDRLATAKLRDRFTFFEKMHSLGVKQLAIAWYPPAAMRSSTSTKSVAPDHIDDYARLIAAELVVLKRHGLVPDAVELLNEPDNKNSPADYAKLVKSFDTWRTRAGVTATEVVGPGTVFTWGDGPYLEAVKKAGAHLDVISTHAYDAGKTHKMASLRPLRRSIPAGWRQPIFVTEYGIDQEVWYPGLAKAFNTVPFAVRAAAQTLSLYGSGANVGFYWIAQEAKWGSGIWGLLDKQDRRGPVIDALKTIIPPLKVSDRIVSSEAHGQALPVMLVKRPSQLLLEIANPSDQARDYNVSLRSCTTPPTSVASIAAWPPGRDVQANLAPSPGLHLTLPPQTVAAITLQWQ